MGAEVSRTAGENVERVLNYAERSYDLSVGLPERRGTYVPPQRDEGRGDGKDKKKDKEHKKEDKKKEEKKKEKEDKKRKK